MAETTDTTALRCSCCGERRRALDVAHLRCAPDTVVCESCVQLLAEQIGGRPAITPIFPVHDMAAAREFWSRAGMDVEEFDAGYAFVMFNGAELAHLDLHPDLDPERNASAGYMHVDDPCAWQARWKADGLPVSDVTVEPWGMVEFSVRDPSRNLIRLGRNG